MEKNSKFTSTVIDINDDGDGVIKINDAVVFVPNVLPNEEIEGIIINAKSKFAIGKYTKILKANPNRIAPPCPYFNSCGGCSLQHLKKETQAEFKQLKVINALKKFGKINADVNKTVTLNNFRYRNKIALPVNHLNQIGLYRKNTHNILEIDDCLITKPWVKTIIEAVKQYMQQVGVTGFNDQLKCGLIKHIVAREIDDQLLITLVVNGKQLPKLEILVEILKQQFNNFGLNINLNTLNNNVILTENFVHIYGLTHILVTDNGITYPVTNASFMQVNDEIKNEIYNDVLAHINPEETVVNAYSGAGLLTAQISKVAKFCYGVEIVKDASTSADILAKNNNITNMKNICGDCTKEIPKLLGNGLTDFTIVVDPPRKGLTPEVVDTFVKTKPNKIIYVSCNPSTLARDVKAILDSGLYSIKSVTPYDMFPQTAHVETLLVLEKI